MFAAKDALLTRPSGGYVIPRSLRFRSSASAYLNRTFGTPTANLTWTYSVWIKRGKLSVAQDIFSCAADNDIYFGSSDTVSFYKNGVGVVATSTQVFRDPSAYGHFVFNSNGTTVNGYYNGSTTAFISYTGTLPNFNSAAIHTIAKAYAGTQYLDGYMVETYFVDGQALTSTSFGATNATTGVWAPIKYAGTYGTNGFHLDFNSYATTAALGTDTSGNGNTWTVNNISVTAGATYDSMIDVPTVGTTGSNYAVLNPLVSAANPTIAEGNLMLTTPTTGYGNCYATMGISSGKWYWESTFFSSGGAAVLNGVANANASSASYLGADANAWVYASDGTKLNNAIQVSYGASYTVNDVIGVALDMDAGTLTFYKNNASQGTAYTGLTGTLFPAFGDANNSLSSVLKMTFGQRPFTYTPPSGYSALNTYNLPAPTILKGSAHMAATTYTGTGASQTIANTVDSSNFQPDFVWMKSRSAATDHALYDSVRGATKDQVSNSATAETTQVTGLTAFGSTGFTVGALAKINTNAATYVGWQWKGGGAAVTNTNGTMSAQVSANPTSGCSICSFTTPSGTVNPNTFGHGLGVAPSFVITKAVAVAQSYDTYHVGVGNTARILLNTTGAASTANAQYWNNTTPSSTVVTIGTTAWWGSSTNYIAYCFAPIAGYSAFGSYTGNGSTDGPFVFTGFRPRWVLFKSSSSVNNWQIYDTAMSPSNAATTWLYPDLANAAGTSGVDIDILSNGFKPRSTNAINNGSGVTYIYAAFAESPFKNSLAR